jgi:hypothetical protein
MEQLVSVYVATDTGTTKRLYVTNPTRFYAVNNGTLTNASIGPNLVDIYGHLSMKTAFCRTVDESRRVHTAVREELNRTWTLEYILSSLQTTALRVQGKLEAQAPRNEANEDLHRTAHLLATFWKNAFLHFVHRKQGVSVEPLAHDNPVGLGVAVFQLMVVFEEYKLREVFKSVVDELDSVQDWPKDKVGNTKAWMHMLILLLDGVNGAKRDKEGNIVGKYYTLKWGEDYKRTRLDFGRKYR